MTPKEKAEELIDKMYDAMDIQDGDLWKSTKQCALVAVDEIDDIYQKLTPKDNPYYFLSELEYWQEVKQEIEQL